MPQPRASFPVRANFNETNVEPLSRIYITFAVAAARCTTAQCVLYEYYFVQTPARVCLRLGSIMIDPRCGDAQEHSSGNNLRAQKKSLLTINRDAHYLNRDGNDLYFPEEK